MSKNFTLAELKGLNVRPHSSPDVGPPELGAARVATDPFAPHQTKKDLHLLIHGKVYAIAKFCDEVGRPGEPERTDADLRPSCSIPVATTYCLARRARTGLRHSRCISSSYLDRRRAAWSRVLTQSAMVALRTLGTREADCSRIRQSSY